MVYLKSCPKCLGDLTVSQDGYGAFISCLQCGFHERPGGQARLAGGDPASSRNCRLARRGRAAAQSSLITPRS